MKTIIINERKFTYQIKRKAISSFRISLKGPDFFIFSCPFLTPDFLISKHISNNANWIFQNAAKISPKKSLLSLKTINILNFEFQFIVTNSTKDWVIIDKVEQKICLNYSSSSENHLKNLLSSRLKTFALTLIKEELYQLQLKYGFVFNRVSLKNQKTCFGSCSSKSNLNFNWQIIFFPPDKFRHILLHELTHLKIKNHSRVFWDQLTIYDPHCKINNHWLKEQGTKCFLF